MQAKKTSLKQKLTAMIIAFAMILSTFTFVSTGSSFTADAAITEAFQNTSVSVPNGEFNESSGAAPRVPSSWTSAPLGNTPEGGTVNGVVDLSLSNITKDNALENLKLDGYDEFKHGISDHLTPFGKDDGKFEGSDSDALMINSNGSKVAYGYKSATLSLTSNSYYKISAWVKTGAFGSGTNDGASIKITGLKNPLVFSGIDTSSEEKTLINDYGWREYSFFIETSTMYNSSVEISLQLGNSYDYTDKYGNEQSEIYTTSGYVC